MQIEQLNWDSDFFGYPVGKIYLRAEDLPDVDTINGDYHKLLYIFSELELNTDIVTKLNAKLVDEKTELVQNITGAENEGIIDNNIISINAIDDNVINLALQSGVYSRFNIDEKFCNQEFEKLYTTWITNSVNRQNAKEVYGYITNGKLAGLVTIGIRNNIPDIGLIAIDAAERGRSIGSILLNSAKGYGLANGYNKLSVITQGANVRALNFYKKNSFEVTGKVYIYHRWK